MRKIKLLSLTLVLALAFSVLAPSGMSAEDTSPDEPVSNSSAMKVTLSPSKALEISQGETGTIRAKVKNAAGTVSYRWEMSTNGGKTWKDIGKTGKTLKVSVTEKNYQKIYKYQYRCRVTDEDGTVCSSPVKIKAPFTVSAPKTVKGGLDQKVKLTATVDGGTGTPAYQWQVSTDNGGKWKNCTYSGNTARTMKVKVTESRYSFLYRCAVTVDGRKMYSNTVRLEKPYTVTVSPEKRDLDTGETGTFKVAAGGAVGKVTYQWQYSKDAGKTWDNTGIRGNRTATLSVRVKNTHYGQMFRCVVSAENGKVISDPVWINPANWSHFQYADNGKNQWIIKKYKKDDASVTVPAGYKGKPVVGIGDSVFKGKSLKKVVIPKTIVTIGKSAFENCAALTTVTLSDKVKSIGAGAFRNCKKLADMKIVNE